MIPDFKRLGYPIMGATLPEVKEPLDKKQFQQVRKATTEIEKGAPHAALMAVNGLSSDKNRLFITFYENYSDHNEAMKLAK